MSSLTTASRLLHRRIFRQGGICEVGYSPATESFILPRYTKIMQQHHRQSQFLIHTSSILLRPDIVPLTPIRRVQQSVYGFFDKHIGITFADKHRWRDLNAASHVLLNSIYMKVDHSTIHKFANLEDSFESWLKIVYLHVWMLFVKLKQHGRDGKILTKAITQLLWQDLDIRAKKIEEELKQNLEVRKQLTHYYELLRISFLVYDEGLLKGDATLAGSLWNQIYVNGKVDPQNLECLVHYIRYTMARLDDIPLERLVLDAENMRWPLPKKFGYYDYEPYF